MSKPNKRVLWLARKYPCSFCHALPGEVCITPEAEKLPNDQVHKTRIYSIPSHIRGPAICDHDETGSSDR